MDSMLLLLLAVVGCASAGTTLGQSKIVRVPEHDSAIIQSHRLGGNFAYSTHEAHAYGVETPIIEQRVVPKGVTYHQGEPIVKTHTSYVKQKVPQYGVVETEHTVPTVQYSAVAPVQQVVTTQQVAAVPVKQVVTSQQVAAAPVQIVQYSAAAPIQYSGAPIQYSGAPIQYSGAHIQYSGAPIQYSSAPVQYSGAPIQYSAAATPIQYSAGHPVQLAGAPVQLAVSPVQYITSNFVQRN